MTWLRPDPRSVHWGFAIHLAGRDRYPLGTPEEALDCACGRCFNDRTA